MARQRAARSRAAGDADDRWFAAAPPAGRLLAALPRSRVFLEEDALRLTAGRAELRIPLVEVRGVEVVVRRRTGRLLLLLGGAIAVSALSLAVFRAQHLDLTLAPLALGLLLAPRVTIDSRLEIDLRSGGSRAFPLALADARLLRRAGHDERSFVGLLEAAVASRRERARDRDG